MAKTLAVDAVILAGGLGSRMGGQDKGLLKRDSVYFAEHLCSVFAPYCQKILVSCNRHQDEYATFSDIVVSDSQQDFLGPLAGICAAAQASQADLLLISPCDTPNLDDRFPQRMLHDLDATPLPRMAHDGQRAQQLHLLVPRHLALGVADYLAKGERSVKGWLLPLQPLSVDFSDVPELFQNINTFQEFSDWCTQKQEDVRLRHPY